MRFRARKKTTTSLVVEMGFQCNSDVNVTTDLTWEKFLIIFFFLSFSVPVCNGTWPRGRRGGAASGTAGIVAGLPDYRYPLQAGAAG